MLRCRTSLFLGRERAGGVLDLVRRLRDDGRGVMMVSHSLPHVLAVSDRIAVRRIGELAATYGTAAVTSDEAAGAITGAGAPVLDGRARR